MPIPSPQKKQSRKDFISSCMGDPVMNKEFPDQKQRAAVCFSKWRDKKSEASVVITTNQNEYIYEKDPES